MQFKVITRHFGHRVKGFPSTKTNPGGMKMLWWRFENASLQNYFLTLPRRLMRRSTIKDTNTINEQTAATAHVGVCSKVYTIGVVSRLNCPLWFYFTWKPEISLSLQSSISASTPLLPRFNRSIMMYANSVLQSMASSTLLLLAASARIDSPNLNLHYWSVRSRSIAEAQRGCNLLLAQTPILFSFPPHRFAEVRSRMVTIAKHWTPLTHVSSLHISSCRPALRQQWSLVLVTLTRFSSNLEAVDPQEVLRKLGAALCVTI